MAAAKSLVVVLLACCLAAVQSFDPQPLKDFDVPGKLPGEVVAGDFKSSLLVGEPVVAPGEGAGALALSVTQFPGLNTQGISSVKLKILPCGMNPPHVHPRGTELLYVLKGRVFVAFIDTTNKIFANYLTTGDTTVFPRGLVHVVVNIGNEPALVLATFNSQNPGTTRVGPALFKSKDANNVTFPGAVLATAFGVSPQTIISLKLSVPTGFPLGTAETGCPSGFF